MTSMYDLIGEVAPRDFESMISDIMKACGFHDVNWRDGSADGGRDIDAKLTQKVLDTNMTKTEAWSCEVKKYSAGVPFEKIHSSLTKNTTRNVNAVILAVYPHLTTDCKDQIKGWIEQNNPKFDIHFWEKNEIAELLLKHSDVSKRYLRSDMFGLIKQMADKIREALPGKSINLEIDSDQIIIKSISDEESDISDQKFRIMFGEKNDSFERFKDFIDGKTGHISIDPDKIILPDEVDKTIKFFGVNSDNLESINLQFETRPTSVDIIFESDKGRIELSSLDMKIGKGPDGESTATINDVTEPIEFNFIREKNGVSMNFDMKRNNWYQAHKVYRIQRIIAKQGRVTVRSSLDGRVLFDLYVNGQNPIDENMADIAFWCSEIQRCSGITIKYPNSLIDQDEFNIRKLYYIVTNRGYLKEDLSRVVGIDSIGFKDPRGPIKEGEVVDIGKETIVIFEESIDLGNCVVKFNKETKEGTNDNGMITGIKNENIEVGYPKFMPKVYTSPKN